MMSDNVIEQLLFVKARLKDIPWLVYAGEPYPSAIVVNDFVEGLDRWNEAMMEVWGKRTQALEEKAQHAIGDAAIDYIFDDISQTIQDDLYQGIEQYLYRQSQRHVNFDETGVNSGVAVEVMFQIKRDMAWMAVEHILGELDFFTSLLLWYEQGRWPCSWSGDYPSGSIVLL
jgi:hypothetical protein